MKNAFVLLSRLRSLTAYTRECASAAWKCDVVVAPSRAAWNRNGRVKIRRRFHGQELVSKVKDTLVTYSQRWPSMSYTQEGASGTQ